MGSGFSSCFDLFPFPELWLILLIQKHGPGISGLFDIRKKVSVG